MYKAINDRIIVCLNKLPQTGIITAQPQTRNQGKVISIGDRVTDIKIGDEIIFHKYDELPLPQENLVVIREKSILCVMQPNA